MYSKYNIKSCDLLNLCTNECAIIDKKSCKIDRIIAQKRSMYSYSTNYRKIVIVCTDLKTNEKFIIVRKKDTYANIVSFTPKTETYLFMKINDDRTITCFDTVRKVDIIMNINIESDTYKDILKHADTISTITACSFPIEIGENDYEEYFVIKSYDKEN